MKRNYRSLDETEEAYYKQHPEEIDDYVLIAFEELFEDNNMPALLSQLRVSAHDVPAKVISMAINGSGVRDTGGALGISPNTVTNILRSQADKMKHIHPDIEKYQGDINAQIQLCLADLEAEMDEQWSFVQNKKNSAGFGTL